jgi:hypothetical protein
MANKIQTVAQLLELEIKHTAELKEQDKVLETLYKRQQGQINSRHQSRARETQLEIDAAEFKAKQSEKDIAQAQKKAGITEKEINALQQIVTNSESEYINMIKVASASKDQVGTLGVIADLGEQILGNEQNIGTEEFKQVDVGKVLRVERRKLGKLLAEGNTDLATTQALLIKELESLENKNQRQKLQNQLINDQNDLIDDSVKSMTNFIGKIPVVGGMLQKQLIGKMDKFKDSMKKAFVGKDGMKMGMMASLGVAGLIIGAIISIANKAKEAGLGMNQLFDPNIGGALLVNSDMVSQMADDFGHINEATTMLGATLKYNQKLLGISTKDSVKILRLQQATSDLSNEELINRQKATAQMAKQAGIPIGKLMEDIASSAEYFALNARDGGDNIARAAVEAKKLGLNLSAVEAIQESLLNLESSLQAQMEAQVLIGRELNLDRARQLALSGDQAGLMQEIVRQAGGEAEFAKLNYIARKKLAQAFGLTGVQLAKVVSGGGAGETTPTLHTGGTVIKSGQVGMQQGEVVRTQTQYKQMTDESAKQTEFLKKIYKGINSQTIEAKGNSQKQVAATRSQGVSAT